MSSDIDSLKEAEKEALRAAETRTPTRSDNNQNWVAGVVLIAIGGIFLVANTTNFPLDNWWALFILIPALSNLQDAWTGYRNNGRFSRSTRHSFTWGLILTTISFTFLFNIDWSYIWPLFLVYIGISMLLGNRHN